MVLGLFLMSLVTQKPKQDASDQQGTPMEAPAPASPSSVGKKGGGKK